MKRTEIITKMCEVIADLANMKRQAEQLEVKMTKLMEEIQTDAEL